MPILSMRLFVAIFIVSLFDTYCRATITDDEFLSKMKYDAHSDLKKTFSEQTMLKLMAVVVNNLLTKDTELAQAEFQNCLKDADSVEKYSQCAVPVVLRHRRNGADRPATVIGAENPVLSGFAPGDLVYRRKRTIKRRKKVVGKNVSLIIVNSKLQKNTTRTTDVIFDPKNKTTRDVIVGNNKNGTVIDGQKRAVFKRRKSKISHKEIVKPTDTLSSTTTTVPSFSDNNLSIDESPKILTRGNDKTVDLLNQVGQHEQQRPLNRIRGIKRRVKMRRKNHQPTVVTAGQKWSTTRASVSETSRKTHQPKAPTTRTTVEETTLTFQPIVNSTGRFTLAPVDGAVSTTTTLPPTTRRNPTLKNVGEFLSDLVQNLKNQYGSWFQFPDIDKALTGKNGNRSISADNEFDDKEYDKTHIPIYNKTYIKSSVRRDDPLGKTKREVYDNLNGFLNSKLLIFKDDVNFDNDPTEYVSMNKAKDNDDTVHMLSPRLMPLAERGDDRPTFLSPDFLSLYEKNVSTNVGSIPSIMTAVNMTWDERRPWLRLMGELTGASDIFRAMKSVEFSKILERANVASNTGVSLPIKQTFDILDVTMGDVYKTVTEGQAASINNKGYATLNSDQIRMVYGEEHRQRLQFDVDEFVKLSDNEKDALLADAVIAMAMGATSKLLQPFVGGSVVNSIVYDESDFDGPGHRQKRQATCIVAPYIGGGFFAFYILNPQILCPSVFSFTIIGCFILSPYILSPYVMGPFILAPEILTPFILSPYVLSPTILTPVVLSPGILNPLVLSPYILSPFVLSPAILSPIVLNPNILGPGVLTPVILSPAVLSPAILSPGVLNPVILSPAVLNPTILSPGVLNPSILSPSVLSPSIASPCLLCRRRRKRHLFLTWLLAGSPDHNT